MARIVLSTAERVARYNRAIALRGPDPAHPLHTLEEIAIALGVTRQRAHQILNANSDRSAPPAPPGEPGRPWGPENLRPRRRRRGAAPVILPSVASLRSTLALWEQRRDAARANGGDTALADARIAELQAQLGGA